MLAAVCTALYVWCENSRVSEKLPAYETKIAAAKLMDKALQAYQDVTAEKGVFSEKFKDSRIDAILGQQYSLITTDLGNFQTKLTGANPNFAAVAVDLLLQAGVGKGDLVAVCYTGSHPGINTAVLCACEALGATPVTIASVSSSWWGATDPDFTWVDMENLLNQRGIVHSKRIGASLGGLGDEAIGLSLAGKESIRAAIARNNLTLIAENGLSSSIERRYRLFKEAAGGANYKVFVNVGDGIASLGHAENGRLIRNGYNRKLPVQNYPSRGVIHRFNSDNVPSINFWDIDALSRSYGLGIAHVPLPAVGTGSVFMVERYNLTVATVALAIALVLILILVKLDSRLFKLSETGVDPDTLM
jgi:poly-gamma-glutamate system protein